MVDQNILQDHAFLGKTAFECRGKTTLISKDEDDIATPCLRFGQDRRLSTADGHQLAHRFATTGLPDSDSPLLAESGLSAQAYANIAEKETGSVWERAGCYVPSSQTPGRRRLRRVAGLGNRAAGPVRYVCGSPREDSASVAAVVLRIGPPLSKTRCATWVSIPSSRAASTPTARPNATETAAAKSTCMAVSKSIRFSIRQCQGSDSTHVARRVMICFYRLRGATLELRYAA